VKTCLKSFSLAPPFQLASEPLPCHSGPRFLPSPLPPLMTLSTSLFAIVATAVFGLEPREWTNPSETMVGHVEALSTSVAALSRGETPDTPVQEIVDRIRELADEGEDKDALFSMGMLAMQSEQEGAREQALDYYLRAAQKGQLQAMNNYGFLLALSAQDPDGVAEGVSYIRSAAEAGLGAARRNLATILLRGLAGQERNPDEAKRLLEGAAETDHHAQFEMAQFHLETGGEEHRDIEKAWEWINLAAELGNPEALSILGALLFEGGSFADKEVEADPEKAVSIFGRLADEGVGVGLRTMGELHASGLAGVDRDFPKALEYFTKASQANDAVAQLILAGFYDTGVKLDPEQESFDLAPNSEAALELYRLAARNNSPIALYNIGIFYENGRAVDRDLQKALASYLEAANNGLVPAMQKAGVFYLNGAGTLRDPVAATAWFQRAAAGGSGEGLFSLGVMSESGLIPTAPPETPFKLAARAYDAALKAPQTPPGTRFDALLRLGNLHFQGALVDPGQAPQPDPESAYLYFKAATDLAPSHEGATAAARQLQEQLTPEAVARAEEGARQLLSAISAGAAEAPATGESGAVRPASNTSELARPAPAAPAGSTEAGASETPTVVPAIPVVPEGNGEPGEERRGFRLPFLRQ